MPDSSAPDRFGPDDARHWAVLTRAALAARRSELDALNVFPVPDGDTGTNLYLTIDTALDAVIRSHTEQGIVGTANLAQEFSSMRQAILQAARGNSGVLFSQLLAGFADVVAEAALQGFETLDGRWLAAGMTRAAACARASVRHPQEGTMLSVADAAASAAEKAAAAGEGIAEVTEAASEAALEALRLTPQQLPILAQANVVDAGGAGAVLLLESLHRAVAGGWSIDADTILGVGDTLEPRFAALTPSFHMEVGRACDAVAAAPSAPGPAYEVMYLLDSTNADAVARLSDSLDALGDSLLVVGGPELFNVHVHVDDPGAAVEAGVVAGRPHRIRITRFDRERGQTRGSGLAAVACAAGPGIRAALENAGAHVVDSAPGRRVSAGQLLAAAKSTSAGHVIFVPNDAESLAAAQLAATAAREDGVVAYVVPARAMVQALAAVAVFDASADLETAVMSMTSAASATRHGAVTTAFREALTSAGRCQEGDVLGVVDGDVVVIGTDLAAVATEVVGRLISSGGELLTIVLGAGAPEHIPHAIRASLRPDHRDIEIETLSGGQDHYTVLIGLE